MGKVLTCMVAGAALVLAGCASSGYRKSPFLGGLSHYHRASHNPDIQQFRKKDVNLDQQRKLVLEPVIFYYQRKRKGNKISDDNARALSRALTDSLAEKLAGRYRLGTSKDHASLVIKLALVNLVPPDGKTRIETDSARIIPVDLSRARLEMKILDAAAKMRLVAGLTMPVGEEIPTMTGGYTSWPVLEKAIGRWSTELAASIDDFTRPIKKTNGR